MTVYYSQPKLKSLSQGDRLAFIRQFRRMSQQELGESIGLPANHARNLICRYEKKNRRIKTDRLKAIANTLNINVSMLTRWDFEDPEDLFYQLLWVEQLCPDFTFRHTIHTRPGNKTHAILSEKYEAWKEMRRKYSDSRISFEEYWEWKLTKA